MRGKQTNIKKNKQRQDIFTMTKAKQPTMLAKYAYNKDRSKNVHREDGTETETCCPVQAKKARTVKK